jgi:hypothetical protein
MQRSGSSPGTENPNDRAQYTGDPESDRRRRTPAWRESLPGDVPGAPRHPVGSLSRLRLPDMIRARSAQCAYLIFALVTLLPVLRRIRHPTLHGDDLVRLINLIEHPLRELIFWPYNEHIAFFFDLISWGCWQLIGHDLRLAPLGYSIAAVVPWALSLVLLGRWLARESGSPTASLVAVAIVAQSPLAVETAWWYSASSFAWAVVFILLALLAAGAVAQRPIRSLILVGLSTALGPAATSLGHLAMPLAILRGLMAPKASRRAKWSLTIVALAGEMAYMLACHFGGTGVFATARRNNGQMADPLAGLYYALTVPGRLLWPSALGVPASWSATTLPPWLSCGAGILTLASLALLALWPRARWNRRLVLLGAAMIYLGYGLTYSARAGLVTGGRWTETQLIYRYATRYHVLPLIGMAAVLAAVLAAWRPIRRCDRRHALPALAGTVVGMMMLAIQHREVDSWSWLLNYSDQRATFAALDRVGRVAKEEGITRAQLIRIVAPALRPWNAPLLTDDPALFSLMKLVAAPEHVARARTDGEARNLLLARLTHAERAALGAGACASLNSVQPGADARMVSVGRCFELQHIREDQPGRYRSNLVPGAVKFAFDHTTQARFLVFPGLNTDQDLIIFLRDSRGRWRMGEPIRWLDSPRPDGPAVVDLEGIMNWSGEPVSEIAIQLTRTGEISLDAPPRMLR